MVTASHNPPKYNGFKVFWADGAQVTPPNDSVVIGHYNQINKFDEIPHMDFDEALKKEKVIILKEDMEQKYYEAIKEKIVNKELCEAKGSNLKIVYTPIHGTGLVPCTEILKQCGFENTIVPEEQALPDETFPTVTSPNPENPEAYL